MNRLITAVLLAALPLNVWAELSPCEKKLSELILSGEYRQLKTSAKQVVQSQNKNTELIDMLAEVLVRTYSEPYPSHIDTLSWVSLSIGQTGNGRYFTLLTEVSENAGHKKLQGHAKKALKTLGEQSGEQYQLGMNSLPKSLYAKESNEVRDARIIALLTAGNLADLKRGAKTIIDTKTQSIPVTDTAAEVLLQQYAVAFDSKIDTLAWLSRALGQSISGRYYDVLLEVSNNSTHKKLRGHAKKALKIHGEAKNQQYALGMTSIPANDYDL